MQNFINYDLWFFFESWSLAVEEWFYLFLPLLVFAYLVVIRSNKKAFLLSALTLIIFSVLYRVWLDLKLNHSTDGWETVFRKVVICRFDALGIGLLFAYLLKYHENLFYKFRYVFFVLGISILIFLMNYKTNLGFNVNVVYLFVTPLSFALCLPICYHWKSVKFSSFGFVSYISKISYSLYLLHLPVASLIYVVLREPFQLTGVSEYVLFWIFSLIIAGLFHRFIEKPLTDLRDKL